MPAHAPKIEPAATAPIGVPHGAQMPPWLRHAARTVLHLACDAVAVAASYLLAYRIRFEWDAWVRLFPIPGQVPDWALYRQMLFVVVPFWLVLFWASCRLYSSWMSGPDRFLHILKGCLLGTAATMFATYIYSRLEYSRMMMLMVFPISSVLVWLSHFLVLRIDDWMARCEAAKPVLVIGSQSVARVIKERINARHPEAEVFELRELPQAPEIEKLLSQRSFYEIILLRSALSHERILAAAEICDARGVAFKMVPDLLELRLGEVQMDHSLGLPSYRIQHTSMTRLNFAAKRTFDLSFSFTLLGLTSPLWLIASLLIKLDSPGSILYKQKRYGYKGRVFWAYKFRTMEEGAESKIQDVRNQNDPSGAFFKVKKDPRVTRVGRFLRRFSLDEFPQFINVLRGEMSVVGPRPLALTTGELERLEKDFGATAKKRMNILPGITGLWQVSGRSDVSSEQRFSLDLFYVEHWSLGLDLEIIVKTIPAVLFGKGAY